MTELLIVLLAVCVAVGLINAAVDLLDWLLGNENEEEEQ